AALALVAAGALAVAGDGCARKAPLFPTCGDNLLNGDETDVDCGGLICTPCNSGKRCKIDKDCRSKVCAGGSCAAPSCTDGVLNGSESDVDCGGPDCAPCADGRGCAGDNDCRSRGCSGGACATPTCSDGFQNGDETGIDCGGSCPPCDASAMSLDLTPMTD
ncbi:MAG TPA: hypothetical protein VF997_02150, partial [Polyangia bacterium]